MNCSSPTHTLSPAQARLCANYRHLALWTFQGWIAMFFAGASYAKLTAPLSSLVVLMGWPAMVDEPMVRAVGLLEGLLGLMMLAPLISWRVGRPPLLVAAAALFLMETAMLVVHLRDFDPGLALTNLFLMAITAAVFAGRRRAAEPGGGRLG